MNSWYLDAEEYKPKWMPTKGIRWHLIGCEGECERAQHTCASARETNFLRRFENANRVARKTIFECHSMMTEHEWMSVCECARASMFKCWPTAKFNIIFFQYASHRYRINHDELYFSFSSSSSLGHTNFVDVVLGLVEAECAMSKRERHRMGRQSKRRMTNASEEKRRRHYVCTILFGWKYVVRTNLWLQWFVNFFLSVQIFFVVVVGSCVRVATRIYDLHAR